MNGEYFMCGIVGIVNKNHDIKIDENVLLLMRDSMFHGGLDLYLRGSWISSPTS